MLYTDLLKKTKDLLLPESNKLINKIWKNQNHKGDLLIWHVNGFYEEKALLFESEDGFGYSPYVIGHGNSGFSQGSTQNLYILIIINSQTKSRKLNS